jgi:hypothetical protein
MNEELCWGLLMYRGFLGSLERCRRDTRYHITNLRWTCRAVLLSFNNRALSPTFDYAENCNSTEGLQLA